VSASAEQYEELAVANRILFDQEIVDGLGHVSFRDLDDPSRFHMSRALAPGRVTPSDILAFDASGEPIDARSRSVYQERFIHSEIYRARPDVHAIVHSHSPTVIPFSVTPAPMRPIRAAFFFPEVPNFEIRDVAGWTNLLVKTPELGAALARTLGANSVALMRGHGNVVVGGSLPEVVFRAIYTEANARLQADALRLGDGRVTYLSDGEAAAATATNARVFSRPWELWKAAALGRID
jgi:ribulose-5-phosphate 4-epimerase/fuculose-1-phosphate aldolase